MRSKFEVDFAKYLKANGISYEYESVKVPYHIEKMANYIPDFLIGDIFIETKGRFTSIDRRKHILVKQQHPELDIRILFMYDNKLSKNSNTRYSDWCNKNGIKFAVGRTLPKKWLDELLTIKTKRRSNAKK